MYHHGLAQQELRGCALNLPSESSGLFSAALDSGRAGVLAAWTFW
jgi:hypothetical protein